MPKNHLFFQAKPKACLGGTRGTIQHHTAAFLPWSQGAHFTLVHLLGQGLREATGINRERQRLWWERKTKALASPKAGLPSFPLCHQHRLQGRQLPASRPHGSHQQPSQSTASMPGKHIGSNHQGWHRKTEGEPNPSKSVCKCKEQQRHAGSAHPA